MSIDRAKALMGISESKAVKQSAHLTNITEAKDGNTYAIVKESSEYVVKVLSKDGDAENIADYQYVGGLANKRNFVYESHRTAVKQLSAKVSLISETYGSDKKVIKEDILKVASLVTESEDKGDCKCDGECQCKVEEATTFTEEEIFEGYNGMKSFDNVTGRNVVEMLTTITEDWGKDSEQAKTIKEFAMATIDTKDINGQLSESDLHKYNTLLSEMGFITYEGNAIMEAIEALEEEKYKLKLDVPTEKEDEGEEEFDSSEFDFEGGEEEGSEGDFGGEEETADEKPFDDEPFDAGVEASEEEDPKKYIQQLAGKLGQSIRDYNSTLEAPDFDLEKFAINSVISATNTADMSEEDQDDIIAKIKEAGEGETNGEVSDEEGAEDSFDTEGSEEDFGGEVEGGEEEATDEFVADEEEIEETGETEELGDEEATDGVDDVALLGQEAGEEEIEIADVDTEGHEDAEEDAEMIEDILSDELLDVIVAKVIDELEGEGEEEAPEFTSNDDVATDTEDSEGF